MTIQKALNTRLQKAKYIKRWRGKDGKYHYLYKQAKKKAKGTDVVIDKAAKQLKGFNVHSATTIVENWKDMGLSKMSIEEATKYWNDEMLDSVTVEQMQAVKVLFIDNKAVKLVSGGRGTMHDFRQPVKVNKVKGYPYEIEAQIDREPFRILMKKPIFFDTSY